MSVTQSGIRTSATALATLCLTGAVASPAAASPLAVSALDRQLLTAAHQGNLWEIATGRSARTDATTACVKQVGAIFVRDHRILDTGVIKTAARLGVMLPSGQGASLTQQALALKKYAKKRGYDPAWLKAQYAVHVQALALIDKEIASGTNLQVKSLARSARPVVQRHVRMVGHGGVCHPGM